MNGNPGTIPRFLFCVFCASLRLISSPLSAALTPGQTAKPVLAAKKRKIRRKEGDSTAATSLPLSSSAAATEMYGNPETNPRFLFCVFCASLRLIISPFSAALTLGHTAKPVLAAKERKNRKKDGAAELLFHCSTAGTGRRRNSKPGGSPEFYPQMSQMRTDH